MLTKKTLTFALMEPPFESTRTVTAMRLMHEAARRGHHVKVFAYEGAVFLPFAAQKAHANAIHGHDAVEEGHPLPKDWVAELMTTARQSGGSVEWVNCGLCVDERGAEPAIAGVRRGSPADLVTFVAHGDNSLVIPAR